LLFNEFGEAMDFFYLRDDHFPFAPYGLTPRYFLWDRHNWGLPVHFYTGFRMFEALPDAERRYGWLREPETIALPEYEELYRNPGIAREYDKIFTFSDKVLDTLANAAFSPACSVWYGNPWLDTAQMDSERYLRKSKNISLVSSNKTMCPMHIQRRDLALACLAKPALGIDVYGTVGGGASVVPDVFLSDYRFHIAYENDIQRYFFTEKILNCFASMAIPLYVGAPGVTEFFNPDGIIFLSEEDLRHPERLAGLCTEREYDARRDAVIDNYQRVQEFLSAENFIYTRYFAGDEYFRKGACS
jgi:hypothetical protein